MKRSQFVSLFMLLFPLVGNAGSDLIKELEGELAGVKIVRVTRPKTEKEETQLKDLREFFVRIYRDSHQDFFESLGEFKSVNAMNDALKARFDQAVSQLESPNICFLEAVEIDSQFPLGMVVFERKEPREIYVSRFATTRFKSKNQKSVGGIGRQLLKSIFEVWPETEAVHLLVLKQHKNVISIYKYFGFEESEYEEPSSPYKDSFVGMTLAGERLRKFRE